MDIAIKPAESNDELRMVHDLLAQVHSGGDYSSALRWLETTGTHYPAFLREHTRIATIKNEVVGGLRLITDTIRLGEARLKMGGIGWVTTAERHRGKGICRLLMDDILAYMREHKYHVSLLFGIPDFYHKFGYVTTLADYSIVMNATEALTFERPFRSRPARHGDIPAIRKIHDANDRGVACSILRSAAHFACRADTATPFQALIDEQGKVIAYYSFSVQDDHVRVDEVGVAEPGLCAAVVGTTAAIAEDKSLGHIRFHVPPPHPFARYLLQFKSRHEMRIDRDADGMMAFIDLGECLELMIPEWENLLARSTTAAYRTEFTLLVDTAGPYRIRVNRGAVDVARVSGSNKISVTPHELMHLVTGYRYPDDILDSRHRFISCDTRLLFTTLFPKRCPYVWRFDRF
ncbi:MAG: GNAT family N-acetyltransferase [Candidatus Hydrogenedentes bacterium]|nr:GNAT family N-acetyltransferase [Candidatus Hydrogenedentota bacterium]